MKPVASLILLSVLIGCGTKEKRSTPSYSNKASRIKKSFKVLKSGPSIESSDFVDISDTAGLGNIKASKFYIYDLNGDDREDLIILPEFYSTPVFYVRTKSGFRKSKKIFFESPVKASFLNIDDFDKDGLPDILVAAHNQKTELTKSPIQLFRGVRSRGNIIFKLDKKRIFKGRNPVTSISTLDYDQDGHLDYYVGNWYDKTKKSHEQLVSDKLYTFKNNKIHDISGALVGENNRSNRTPTYGVSHCDLDGDGTVDILTSSSSGFSNKLWIGKKESGVLKFRDRAKDSGFDQDQEGEMTTKGGGNSTYSLCADYNNDGIMDLVVGEISHSYDSETRDRSSILTGEGLGFPPTFIRNEYISDLGKENWNQGDQRANWLDINNDGLIDLMVENSGFPPHTRLILFVQEKDHAYVDFSKKMGLDVMNPIGSTYFDYNGDGKLDILVSQTDVRNKNIKKKLFLFENRLAQTGKWISLKLEGKNSNKNAIGAKVVLRTKDGREQTRWHQVNSGPFPSQNSQYLHFGLGKSSVKEVVVHWPFEKNKKKVIQTFKPPFKNVMGHSIISEY